MRRGPSVFSMAAAATGRALWWLLTFAVRASARVWTFPWYTGGPLGPPVSRTAQLGKFVLTVLAAIGSWVLFAAGVEGALWLVHLWLWGGAPVL